MSVRSLVVAVALTVCVVGGCQANDTFIDELPPEPGFSCVPNLDGRIDADEMPVRLDLGATFRVSAKNAQATVSTRGEDPGSGGRSWPWTTDTKTDELITSQAQRLDGKWYADTFPDAAFALPLDRDAETVGLYRKDAEALWLLGFASTSQEPPSKRSLARYSQPVAVVRFPLRPGRKWTSTARLSGAVVLGLPFAGEHRYHVNVDGAGMLRLPDLSFSPALRVRTRFENAPLVGQPIVQHTTSLVFECFGEVARLVADKPESTAGTSTGELWRYHP